MRRKVEDEMINPRTRRLSFRNAFVLASAIIIAGAIPAFAQSPNVVVQWNNAALQGVRDSKIGSSTPGRPTTRPLSEPCSAVLFVVQNPNELLQIRTRPSASLLIAPQSTYFPTT